jgi:hypothetical protein
MIPYPEFISSCSHRTIYGCSYCLLPEVHFHFEFEDKTSTVKSLRYLKADSSFSLKKYSLGTFALFGCRKPVNVVELKLLGQKEEVP